MAFAAPKLAFAVPTSYQSGPAPNSGAGSAPAASPAPIIKPAPSAPGRTFGLATTAARMAGDPISTRSPIERPPAPALKAAVDLRSASAVSVLANRPPSTPAALKTAGTLQSLLRPTAPTISLGRNMAPAVGGIALKQTAPAPAPVVPVAPPKVLGKFINSDRGRVTATPRGMTVTQGELTVGPSPTPADTFVPAAPRERIPTRETNFYGGRGSVDTGLAPTGYGELGTSKAALSAEPSGFGSQIVIAVVAGMVLWLLTSGGAS